MHCASSISTRICKRREAERERVMMITGVGDGEQRKREKGNRSHYTVEEREMEREERGERTTLCRDGDKKTMYYYGQDRTDVRLETGENRTLCTPLNARCTCTVHTFLGRAGTNDERWGSMCMTEKTETGDGNGRPNDERGGHRGGHCCMPITYCEGCCGAEYCCEYCPGWYE